MKNKDHTNDLMDRFKSTFYIFGLLALISALIVVSEIIIFFYYQRNVTISKDTFTEQNTFILKKEILKCGLKSNFSDKYILHGKYIYFIDSVYEFENLFLCNIHNSSIKRLTDNFVHKRMNILKHPNSSFYYLDIYITN